MELWPITFQEFKSFFLILIRVSVILFMFPFFSTRAIPVPTKAGLALLITIILFPVMNHKIVEFPETLLGVGRLITAELMIGMILGLMVQIFFEGVRIMGQMVGFQTGFAIANIIDPYSGSQISVLANMGYFVAIVLFLAFNGHHIMLKAMKESFEIIHIGSFTLDKEIFEKIMHFYGDMFVIAVKMGAPAIAALLFTKVVFGLITKLIPQMNIMIVAFPVQIVIGLLFFGISLNLLLAFTERYVGGLYPLLIHAMNWLKV